MNAIKWGSALPDHYVEASFPRYNTLLLRTDSLTLEEFIEFRDKTFSKYYASECCLSPTQSCLGDGALCNIADAIDRRTCNSLVKEVARWNS